MVTRNAVPERIIDRPLANFVSPFANFFAGDELFPIAQEFSARAAVTIYEENNQLHVEIPIPGLSLGDIEVSLNKGVLFVKGETAEEAQNSKRRYYRYAKRNYSYSIALPTQIDERQEPQAVFVDGVLNVSLQLAKNEETKKIAVKAGSSKR